MKKISLILIFILCAVIINAQNPTVSKGTGNRIRIRPNQLPREITTVSMGTDHLGYAIKDAYRITQGKVTNYEIHITNGSVNKSLLYDTKGKIIKLLESKPAFTPKTEPGKSPVTTATTAKPAAPPPPTVPGKK